MYIYIYIQHDFNILIDRIIFIDTILGNLF